MATALGIENPNSLYNRDQRRLHLPALPISLSAKIHNLQQEIRATAQMRSFYFLVGNMNSARLHAIRIGVKRAELRRLRGQS